MYSMKKHLFSLTLLCGFALLPLAVSADQMGAQQPEATMTAAHGGHSSGGGFSGHSGGGNFGGHGDFGGGHAGHSDWGGHHGDWDHGRGNWNNGYYGGWGYGYGPGVGISIDTGTDAYQSYPYYDPNNPNSYYYNQNYYYGQ